jgi:hypothetical protein
MQQESNKRPAGLSASKTGTLKQKQKDVAEEETREKTQELVQRLTELKAQDGFDNGWKEYFEPTFKGAPEDFVFPAHVFGEQMIVVVDRRNKRRLQALGVTTCETFEQQWNGSGKRNAYMEGYLLWFSCARPMSEVDNQLFLLTVYNEQWSSKHPQFEQREDVHLRADARAAFAFRAQIQSREGILRAQAQLQKGGKSLQEPAATFKRPSTAGRSSEAAPLQLPGAAGTSAMAVVQDQAPRTPLLPSDRYSTEKSFLKSPRDWHQFKTKSSMKERVVEQLVQRKMFAVGPLRDEENRPAFRSLETTCGDPTKQFDQLIARINFEDLLARRLAGDKTRLPGLKLVGRGTYNSIWGFARDFDPTAAPLSFPEELFRTVPSHEMVLRVQTVMPNDRDLLREHVAIDQMSNMVEAAIGEYGPAIYGMAFTRMMVDIPYQGLRPRYRIYTLMAKGSKDLNDSLHDILQVPRIASDREVNTIFSSLLETIWRYSVDHFVFIDAKLTNFIDITKGMIHHVRAIDLDHKGFRPIAPPVAGGMTQAWRPIWLYNVLNMSVQLRMRVPYEDFKRFWWLKIKPAIKQTLEDIHGENAFGEDEEFRRAAAFVRASKWTGDLLIGPVDVNLLYQTRPMPLVQDTGRPEEMAAEVVNIAKYYFMSAWYQRAYNGYVQNIRNTLRQFDLKDPRRRQSIEKFQANYRAEFAQALPMIRHFKQQATLATPRLLVDVMFDYCRTPDDRLYSLYMVENKTWAPWQLPNPVVTQFEADRKGYWEQQLGLEFKQM